MITSSRLPLLLAVLGSFLAMARVSAQTTTPSTAESEPAFLKALPRPPDQPRSLLMPALPPGSAPLDLEGPYFRPDPLLDPPRLGGLGWFADMDVGLLKPHLKNQLTNTVTFPDGTTATVGLPAATLNWTVSPRFEVGYSLPSGFGAISLGYRFLVSEGTNLVIGPDGPATLKSRLDVNMADLDWSSREYTPWTLWDVKIHVGLRYLSIYFDSQASEPFAAAASGTGIFSSRTTNSFVGIGPHTGLDLSRRLGFGGLAIVGSLDLTTAFGRIRQGFFASSTTPGVGGSPQTGEAIVSSSMAVPVINTRLGLGWQPPTYPGVRLFAGYQFEYFWDAGRLLPINTYGDFFDSGAVLKAEFNF